jgi:hypothetical protein
MGVFGKSEIQLMAKKNTIQHNPSFTSAMRVLFCSSAG